MSTRALLSCFLFIRDHWLMLTLELQLIDVLHKIISQAGDLGWMPPLDSIQSTPHLFWYNYLLSLRFIAVVARGMRLNACSALHRNRNHRIYEVLSSINCYWNNWGWPKKSANESQTTCVRFNAHILYLHSIYLSQKISNNYVRQVWSFSKKKVHSTSHIIFDIYFP